MRQVSATPKRATAHVIRGPECTISYSSLLEKTRKAFAGIGILPEAFALHVLRISGATEAARADVPDRLAQFQGGWKSIQTVRGYQREGLPVQAKVNQAMLSLLDNGKAPDFV